MFSSEPSIDREAGYRPYSSTFLFFSFDRDCRNKPWLMYRMEIQRFLNLDESKVALP